MEVKKSQFFCLGVLAVAYYYRITFSHHLLDDSPILSIRQGAIRGRTLYSRSGQKFFEFMNIPYAKAPVGQLRFESPEPGEVWDGVRDASQYGARCAQLDSFMGVVEGVEDCLTINVFTPSQTLEKNVSNLPVIVYFHGGFFHNGGADFWKPHYWMDEPVIFVTFNFRLAALGFLNTGDGSIRGNMGLKDQSMALKWVQGNVHFFGGDPHKVTLLGESAGAVCSHIHLFSPMSKGLFSKAVSLSGSAFHFWSINTKPREQAKRFAKSVGCEFNDTLRMKTCLKGVDVTTIIEGHNEMMDPLRDSIAIFKPSLEVDMGDGQAFLTELPTELVKRGDFAKVPWVTGVNSEEGLIFSAGLLVNETMQSVAEENWQHFIDRIIWFSSDKTTSEKVKHFYFGNSKYSHLNRSAPYEKVLNMSPLTQLDSYTNMISDRGFYYDTHVGSQLQAAHSPVYLYYYSYRGEWSVVNFFPKIYGTFSRQLEVTWSMYSTWVANKVFGMVLPNYGASHSDELFLLFYMPWISEIYSESKDYRLSVDMIKLWTQFASIDDDQLQFRDISWPTVGNATEGLKYMNIDQDAKIIDEPFTHRVEFWKDLLNSHR